MNVTPVNDQDKDFRPGGSAPGFEDFDRDF